jgi:hypothetical protein
MLAQQSRSGGLVTTERKVKLWGPEERFPVGPRGEIEDFVSAKSLPEWVQDKLFEENFPKKVVGGNLVYYQVSLVQKWYDIEFVKLPDPEELRKSYQRLLEILYRSRSD